MNSFINLLFLKRIFIIKRKKKQRGKAMSEKKKATILCFHNRKGGVAKTNLCVNLAFIFSKDFKKKVLIIDTDTQINSTNFALSRVENPNRLTIKDVVENESISVRDVIEKAEFPWVEEKINVFCLPGSRDPRKFSDTAWINYKNDTIANICKEVEEDYDFIFIDTPPNTHSTISFSALIASDYVIVPTELSNDSIEGIYWAQEDLQYIHEEDMNGKVDILGVIATRCNATSENKLSSGQKDNWCRLKEEIPDLISKVFIPTRACVDNSTNAGIPVCFDGRCKSGYADYLNVAKQVRFWLKKKGVN